MSHFTPLPVPSLPLHLPSKSGVKAATSIPTNIVRVLYVHSSIDEKTSSTMLEEVTSKLVLSPILVFTCVTSAFMAVECVQSTAFDIVIVQKDLPVITGLELVNILFRHNVFLPVIFLASRTDRDSLSATFKAPANVTVECLADPYTPLELCSAIYRALHARRIFLRFSRGSQGPIPSSSSSSISTTTEPKPSSHIRYQLPETLGILSAPYSSSSSCASPSSSSSCASPCSFSMVRAPALAQTSSQRNEDDRPKKRMRPSAAPVQPALPALECTDDFPYSCQYPFHSSLNRESNTLLSIEEEELLWQDLLEI